MEKMDFNKLADEIVRGAYAKFDGNYHPKLLLEIFADGGDSWDFCAAAKVGQSTFQKWTKIHEKFGKCYEVAKALAYAAVANNPKWDDPQMFPRYRLMMKNRFNYTEQRKIKLDELDENATIQDQYKTLIRYMKSGELTTHEMNQLSNMLLAAIKIDEYTDLVKRLEEAEKTIKSKL